MTTAVCGAAATLCATSEAARTPAVSSAVTSPATARVAYLVAPTTVVVGVPGGAQRRFTVQDGCVPSAITTTELYLTCVTAAPTASGLVNGTSAVTIADGSRREVPVQPLGSVAGTQQAFVARRAGSRWIAGEMAVESAIGSGDDYPVLVDARSGAVIDLTGAYARRALRWGAHRYVELSAVLGYRTLCRPLTRAPSRYDVEGRYSDLVKVGPWVLRDVPRAAPQLQRCGSARRESTGRGAALGHGYAAWISAHRIRLERLSSGSVRRIRYFGPTPSLRFSSTRLIVTSPSGFADYRLRRAP